MATSVRALNIIARLGADSLAAMDENEAFSIKNCGLGTLKEIALYLRNIEKPFKDHDRIMERLSPKKQKISEDRMTLRDRLAAHALPGLIDRHGQPEAIASMACRISDAMLEARKK